MKPCSVKRGLNSFAKSIAPCQPALSAQADRGPILFAILKFSACKRLIVNHDLVSCLPFPEKSLVFTCLHFKSSGNTVGKGEIARNEHFLFFPRCFLPFGITPASSTKFKIVVCKRFKFGRQNIVVWERVKQHGLFMDS